VTRNGWLGAAAVAALAWFSSPELPAAARFWASALLAGLPALMVVQARQLRDVEVLPRVPAYVSSIISLWLLMGATLFFAWAGGMTPAAMGFVALPLHLLLAWTGGLTAAGLLTVLVFHRAGFRESAVTQQLIPETRSEKAVFAGVSVTAGICEEVVFRGFLLAALTLATGSVLLALVLSSAVFGIVHAYQHPVGAVRAGLLGAMLAAPVLIHGSLYPAILAHAFIDVVAGFFLARYLSTPQP
jgi:uncharacterized protein